MRRPLRAIGFTGISGTGTVVRARFAEGREAEADVLVGADRAHSVVRTALLGPSPIRYRGYTTCAQGLSDEQRVEEAITPFVRSGLLIRPTLPLVAMSSGVDRLLAEHLGSAHIEDLPRRFFCVSANLTRAEEVVHERGLLWHAVRASLSLPASFRRSTPTGICSSTVRPWTTCPWR